MLHPTNKARHVPAGAYEGARSGRAPSNHSHTRFGSPGGNTPWSVPQDVILNIRERADLLGIIAARMELKKSGGGSFVGLCPFHGEKSPSFAITPARGTYHCFGCGAHGDAIAFLMEHDGLPFRDALKEAGQTCGVTVPDPPPNARELTLAMRSQAGLPPSDPQAARAASVSIASLYEANERAAAFFRQNLQAEMAREGSPVRAYVLKRGLTQESLDRFEIGYAPESWQGLSAVFDNYENSAVLEVAGLVRDKVDEQSGRPRRRYDFFRDRLMFPLRDGRGRVVAFGGRTMADGDAAGPKYVNTPETPVFSKSSALYGFLQSREGIRKAKMAIAVEGYMDVVMLHQYGVQCAIACMGTALTKTHVERLMTQSDRLVFSFDGDAAGRKAAERAIETSLPFVEDRHNLRFLLVPDGQDPDEMVQAKGAAGYLETVAKAPGLPEFMLKTLSDAHNGLTSMQDRAAFASRGHELADMLPPGGQLKRILKTRIDEQAGNRAPTRPGARTGGNVSGHRIQPAERPLWAALRTAVELAPEKALAERNAILPLLDTKDDEEAELAVLLRFLDEGDDLPPPKPAPEHERLCAEDMLAGASGLIARHRKAQSLKALQASLASGDISRQEFFALNTPPTANPSPTT